MVEYRMWRIEIAPVTETGGGIRSVRRVRAERPIVGGAEERLPHPVLNDILNFGQRAMVLARFGFFK